ncbi:MAG TPA: hypothetical protein VK184_17720 [Nostocaceae cyanobacterium]|nr:hypothetical protein [Nostocaceae cyanobacterium]
MFLNRLTKLYFLSLLTLFLTFFYDIYPVLAININNQNSATIQQEMLNISQYLKYNNHNSLLTSSTNVSTTQNNSLCQPVIPGKIYRFIQGIDDCVQPMTEQEISQKLNDPFATSILRQNQFPDSVDALVNAINNSGLGFEQKSYMVGEGSQIPLNVADRDKSRNLRYAVTWGSTPTKGDILLSAAAPGSESRFIQVISWDSQAKKYNFYEFRKQKGQKQELTKVWSWAGDTPLAQNPQTMGHGCFDCHHNGVIIMKELKRPWNNWHSQLATISQLVVPLAVTQEKLFQQLSGAENLETTINSGFQTYYRSWLQNNYLNQGGTVQLSNVNEMLRHLTTNTTVNLLSTQTQSKGENTSPPNANITGIPNDFFLWDSALRTALKLDYQIPAITFNRPEYDNYLKQHQFKLVQSDVTKPDLSPLYEQDGSTYFAFFVPVPAAEDLYFLTQLLSAKIITDKFATALLMVDFRNPVFSDQRSSLQKYAQTITSGTINLGVSSVPNDFAEKVRAVAASQPTCDTNNIDKCTAEQQFLYTWDLPDNQWQSSAVNRIEDYLQSISQMSSAEQLDQLMRLSVQRRNQFKTVLPFSNLNEFSLLLPQTDLSRN